MPLIKADHFQALLTFLTAAAPDLLPTCRWLACGPNMAPLILGEDARGPRPADLARLAAQVETAGPGAAAAGRALLAAHDARLTEIEIALERLIAAGEEEWSHPTQILGRPCPEFTPLLAACRELLDTAIGNDRRRFESVHGKLERAASLETRARRRRAAETQVPTTLRAQP